MKSEERRMNLMPNVTIINKVYSSTVIFLELWGFRHWHWLLVWYIADSACAPAFGYVNMNLKMRGSSLLVKCFLKHVFVHENSKAPPSLQ